MAEVAFHYAGGAFELRVPALHVAAGEHVALIGPSGSGKSTVAGLIAGLYRPLAGRIDVGGTVVSDLGDGARRDFRSANIGLVFQEFELIDYLTVAENILLPYLVNRSLRLDAEVRERARELATSVGLGDRLRARPRQLSHGERQRLAICRALVTQPRLVIADEPTGNLDPQRARDILDLLFAKARARGATLLTITHDHSHLARFDRVLDLPQLTGSPTSP